LTDTDRRNLAITFVGGFGAIVAAGVVIGGAIGLMRVIAPDRHKIQWGAVFLVTALWLDYLAVLRPVVRRLDGAPRVIVVTFAVLTTAFVILLWVGLVAVVP
jgi:hypothetical protein